CACLTLVFVLKAMDSRRAPLSPPTACLSKIETFTHIRIRGHSATHHHKLTMTADNASLRGNGMLVLLGREAGAPAAGETRSEDE
ncbi:MAG: hypothetical protein WBE32_09830, partial [Pseudolabrys sp.]